MDRRRRAWILGRGEERGGSEWTLTRVRSENEEKSKFGMNAAVNRKAIGFNGKKERE